MPDQRRDGFSIRKLAVLYLAATGLFLHLLALGLILLKPDMIFPVVDRLVTRSVDQLEQWGIYSRPLTPDYALEEEIAANFPAWEPMASDQTLRPGEIRIGDQTFLSLQEAVRALRDYDTLLLGPGRYQEPLLLKNAGVTVQGIGRVVFDGAVRGGKGTFIIKGDHTTLRNLECHSVSVRDRNGACVRLEASNLKLEHVYFHDSQQGLLAGRNTGTVEVSDSRFELLGFGGRAHGIYVGSGNLIIRDSLFIAAKGEGHEIKSKAEYTLVERSVVASFSSRDSRLIDVPSGGVLIIRESVLAQGPNSSNADAIGYGLEGLRHSENRVSLHSNVFLLERAWGNRLIHLGAGSPEPVWNNNVIIGGEDPGLGGINAHFKDRASAALNPYPKLPALDRFGLDKGKG